MSYSSWNQTQVTVRLDRRTLGKAKTLAAKQRTSISALVAEEIE